jgi:hypothetical protein
MATRTTVVEVSAPQAFEVMEDPRSLSALLLGARKVRRFDPRWPEAGSALHHRTGLASGFRGDRTVVTECVPGERLALQAGTPPMGRFLLTFQFAPCPAGCLLTVEEKALRGPGALPGIDRVAEWLVGLRTALVCRRFRRRAGRSGHGAAPRTPGNPGLFGRSADG